MRRREGRGFVDEGTKVRGPPADLGDKALESVTRDDAIDALFDVLALPSELTAEFGHQRGGLLTIERFEGAAGVEGNHPRHERDGGGHRGADEQEQPGPQGHGGALRIQTSARFHTPVFSTGVDCHEDTRSPTA